MCKRPGYSGYKEFKNNLISDVIYSRDVDNLITDQALNVDATTEVIAEKTYALATSILDDGYKIMDPAIIDLAVDKIIAE